MILIRLMFYVALFALAGAAVAAVPGHRPDLDLDETDVIRGDLRVWSRGNFFVGEPVVLSLRLSNHARERLTVETNFIPQSFLEVQIQPVGGVPREYGGPYRADAYYMPSGFLLDPLQELGQDLIIWADSTQPDQLAFHEPGDYRIDVSLRIRIAENENFGQIPFDPIMVRIHPTPPEVRPMVERLAELELFGPIQRRTAPPEAVEELEMMLATNQPNPIFPYIFYALANRLSFSLEQDDLSEHERAELLDKILQYYQLAAMSSSGHKMAAYLDLLRLLNREDLSTIGAEIARQLVNEMDDVHRGLIGGPPGFEQRPDRPIYFPGLLARYLRNTPELDRDRYWTLVK